MSSLNSCLQYCVVVAIFAMTLIYLLHRSLLSKPIPGIPHNKHAAKNIMGDIDSFLDSQKQGISMFRWVAAQAENLQSPIIQLFMRPLSPPTVIVTDFREAEDISMRRYKEFDRTDFLRYISQPLMPQFHMMMKSDDPMFKRQRKWLQDLMTPAFLHGVVAKPIYESVQQVVELWENKARLADGHPFEAFNDIYFGAFDAVLAFSYSSNFQHMTLPGRLQLISALDRMERPAMAGLPVVFPESEQSEVIREMLQLAETVEETRKAVVPWLRSWYIHQTPRIKTAKRIRDESINHELETAVKRLEANESACSALDHMVYREKRVAEKEGRAPVYKSIGMQSEAFGFLLAGHETTATTFGWGIKYLTDNPDAQRRLREALRQCLPVAVEQRRNPTHEEIIKTIIPYLDATIEEILRFAGTTSVTDREAMQDTTILGHHIPKGTNVMMVTVGKSILKPAFEIPDTLRSKTALDASSRVRSWESSPYPVEDFKPERWLVKSDKDPEKTLYDATAGPQMAFGLGPRACFGRRLAYLELRMLTALLIWNFDFLSCPPELSDYRGYDGLTVKPRQCYVKLSKITL
ncbi:cytochrome P450 monooxygenase [Colletotrichum paranaense]|uniref:Cytochrome P450 monooxygenase n=1 Tax=Colletotrichum paranaense TaxID=1914294 RepID=A0ABQ9SP88_9PEZI|nr:cytochrome P450 monooxygenase [Colletotrichum paranaense]KAK1540877.1 cytochrome P450 monooxygenase [Colletotrichum paranaense]